MIPICEMAQSLTGNVALVVGATRGAGRGIAVQLGAAGATVYVTGRSSGSQRSEMNRAETIEETAALVSEAGGRGIAVQVDEYNAKNYRVSFFYDLAKAAVNRMAFSAKVYGFTDLDGSQPDAWRYVVEVQDAGKPADVTGYR